MKWNIEFYTPETLCLRCIEIAYLVSIFWRFIQGSFRLSMKIYPLKEIGCSAPCQLYLAQSSCNLEVLLPEEAIFPFTAEKSVYWMDYLDYSNCLEKNPCNH